MGKYLSLKEIGEVTTVGKGSGMEERVMGRADSSGPPELPNFTVLERANV